MQTTGLSFGFRITHRSSYEGGVEVGVLLPLHLFPNINGFSLLRLQLSAAADLYILTTGHISAWSTAAFRI